MGFSVWADLFKSDWRPSLMSTSESHVCLSFETPIPFLPVLGSNLRPPGYSLFHWPKNRHLTFVNHQSFHYFFFCAEDSCEFRAFQRIFGKATSIVIFSWDEKFDGKREKSMQVVWISGETDDDLLITFLANVEYYLDLVELKLAPSCRASSTSRSKFRGIDICLLRGSCLR